MYNICTQYTQYDMKYDFTVLYKQFKKREKVLSTSTTDNTNLIKEKMKIK